MSYYDFNLDEYFSVIPLDDKIRFIYYIFAVDESFIEIIDAFERCLKKLYTDNNNKLIALSDRSGYDYGELDVKDTKMLKKSYI